MKEITEKFLSSSFHVVNYNKLQQSDTWADDQAKTLHPSDNVKCIHVWPKFMCIIVNLFRNPVFNNCNVQIKQNYQK